MKNVFFPIIVLLASTAAFAQQKPKAPSVIKQIETTPVKYQAKTNTCWSYSTTSMVESECLRTSGKSLDLSEMFTARNLFIEKAKRFIQSDGATLFEAGGLGHDALYGIVTYGAIPEFAYPSDNAIKSSEASSTQLETILKRYLESCVKTKPAASNWLDHFTYILDSALGAPPATFIYEGKEYTPVSFARDILKIKAEDYITITSFTHHPFYQNFALEIPDNYLLKGSYFNVPVDEMLTIAETAIQKGYGVVTDMDVTNNGWNCRKFGFAMNLKTRPDHITDGDMPEDSANQAIRQMMFDNKTTQDDHLIHLVGIAQSEGGKRFFILKDSGGKNYGFSGFDYVSDNYFIINTLSIMLPKAALSDEMRKRISN
jgi:bleomycin hydrolase